MTTAQRTIVAGRSGAAGDRQLGYRQLVYGPGEVHTALRTDDAPAAAGSEALVTIAHLSDLHVCDTQSPARIEFLDRFADPDSPVRPDVGPIGTYRPQEILTAQVVDAMARAVNQVGRGPVGGQPVDLAVVTGDNTDNAQANELSWYLRLLDGGEVRADSGDLTRYEGVADSDVSDDRYWHPDPGVEDRPKQLYGYPSVPGLLDAVRRPILATGLDVPWLAVHGNHDRMLQGTVPDTGPLAAVSIGGTRALALPSDWSTGRIRSLLAGLERCDPAAIRELAALPARAVTADRSRRVTFRAEFVAAHLHAGARPRGHGYHAEDVSADRAYYRHDRGAVTFLTLDTVNPHGGWEGSLEENQLHWLGRELDAADDEQRYVVLLSHHPLDRLVNGRSAGGRRVLAPELARQLATHPSLVLWLNGHTHHTTVKARASWWEITTPSLIDWPQQGRIVELLRAPGGRLLVATTMIDHLGQAPWAGSIDSVDALAGLSRELSANVWQERYDDLAANPRAGRAVDRNAVFALADPFVETPARRVSALHRG